MTAVRTSVSEEDWQVLMDFLLRLIAYHRPDGELAKLAGILNRAARGPAEQAELAIMIKTQTDAWLEEGMMRGWERGREEGLERGRELGSQFGARGTLLYIGQRRLGEPTAEQRSALDAIDDFDRLMRMADAVTHSANWDEVLATP